MRMTVTMQVLKLLTDKGECTLGQVVDATEIPIARVVASLGTLARAQEVSRIPAEGGARYAATAKGSGKVASWGGGSAENRGAGRG